MGLLSRARSSFVDDKPTLDEMGKVLLERLLRLPVQKSTPYTVLSLLKAYGAFQTGACLSLDDDTYTCYASLGLGTEQISIPYEKIWPEGKTGKNYFRMDDPGTNLDCWVFPLDSRTIVTLGVSPSAGTSAFDPKPVSIILESAAQKIIPPQALPPPDLSPRQNADTTLGANIDQFYHTHSEFNCILLEIPAGMEGDDIVSFCKKVTAMISMTGIVVTLESGRPLVLLPETMDRELIAHRLSKALNTKPLLSFSAHSTKDVLDRLHSLA